MDELEVVDYSKGIESGLDLGLRLSEGIPVLNAGESVMLQPDMDEVGDNPEEEETGDYYSRTLSNLQHLNFNEQNDFEVTDNWSDQKLKMIPLTADGGVYKWKTNTGGKGSGVPYKASVTLFYEAMIEGQDEPFDSSFIRGIPERFKLDCNQLLSGMEIIIKTMNEGETTIGILSPEYAYGRHGVPPRIPANSEILVRIKLLRVTEETAGQSLLGLPVEDRMKLGLDKILEGFETEHAAGNKDFKSERWFDAISHYDVALKLLDEKIGDVEPDKKEFLESKLCTLTLNKVQCYLRMNLGKKAEILCKKVIQKQPMNAKAYFLLSKANQQEGGIDEALQNLQEAMKLKPGNRDIEKEFGRLDMVAEKHKNQEINYCQNMFKSYDKISKEQDPAVLSSPIYLLLKEFKEDQEGDGKIVLESIQDSGTICTAAEYLNLSVRKSVSFDEGLKPLLIITRRDN